MLKKNKKRKDFLEYKDKVCVSFLLRHKSQF